MPRAEVDDRRSGGPGRSRQSFAHGSVTREEGQVNTLERCPVGRSHRNADAPVLHLLARAPAAAQQDELGQRKAALLEKPDDLGTHQIGRFDDGDAQS